MTNPDFPTPEPVDPAISTGCAGSLAIGGIVGTAGLWFVTAILENFKEPMSSEQPGTALAFLAGMVWAAVALGSAWSRRTFWLLVGLALLLDLAMVIVIRS